MKIESLDPTDYLRIEGKGLITSMGIKSIGRSKKNKKARYAITNISMKDLSKIIKEFEKLPYKGRGTAQDVLFFYTPYHLSELQSFKSIISTDFSLIFIFK